MRKVYSLIDQKILFPLAERFYGSDILNEFKRLRESDFFDRKRLEAIQRNKITSLINYCYKYVPYYKELFDSVSLKPCDIISKQDLFKIPILTKQLIRDNYDKFVTKNLNKRKIKSHSTGGSTGIPLQFTTDINTWNASWASTIRAWQWYGLNLGEKIFTIGGHSLVSERKILSKKDIFDKYLIRNTKYSSSEMKPEDMLKHYRAFMKIKPVALRGYASTLYVFAKFIETNSLPIQPIKLILTTGEVLLSTYRAKLQEIFQVPVYDSYGAGDGGIASHECYMHEGLHITEERWVIEICDKDGNVLDDGQIGHVITTDLYNYAFPFLRYSVGDMSYVKKEFCSCGRKSRLLGEVLGRNGRLLYSKEGVPISPTMLPVLLYRNLDYNNYENQVIYNKIDRFKIQQDEHGDLTIILKMKNSRDESFQLFSYVIDNYKNCFPGSEIYLRFVDKIDALPSGKEDYVISKYEFSH